MTYEMFREEFTKRLRSSLGETGDLYERTVNKVNAAGMDALCLQNGSLCPTIYIQEMYDIYLKGDNNISEIVDQAHNMLITALHRELFLPDFSGDYIKLHAIPRVIGTKGNEDFIKDKPHYHLDDLTVLYAMGVDGVADGYIWINNELMHRAYLTHEELHEAALINMEMEPPVIASMSSILGLPSSDGNMIVVTNQSKLYGAAEAFLSPGVQNELQDRLGEYIIIPSSVHEVIAIPARGADPELLKDMVREVNDTQVDLRDRLSYNIYNYDSSAKRLGIYHKPVSDTHNVPAVSPMLQV